MLWPLILFINIPFFSHYRDFSVILNISPLVGAVGSYFLEIRDANRLSLPQRVAEALFGSSAGDRLTEDTESSELRKPVLGEEPPGW